MAVNFGQLTQWILDDTNRDASTLLNGGVSSATYKTAVQRAIVTAIKYMESSLYWAFKTSSVVTILDQEYSVSLPPDFSSLVAIQFSIGSTLYSLREGFVNLSFPEMLSFYQNSGEQGTPRKYAIYDDRLYIYPLASGDTNFTLYYYQKDVFYPQNDEDTSIWFSDETVDLVRMKAMERFYHDTLQAPEIASRYTIAVDDFERNLMRKNNLRQNNNVLSI